MGFILIEWSCFVQSFKQPDSLKKKNFAKLQEAKRKEVERTFGILQGRFNILSVPGRSWSTDNMKMIVKACDILHNMIIDDQRDDTTPDQHAGFIAALGSAANVVDLSTIRQCEQEFRPRPPPMSVAEMSRNMQSTKDKDSYIALRQALIEHHWEMRGQSGIEQSDE